MARTVKDVLALWLRLLFLDADAAIYAAPAVANVMDKELQQDQNWAEKQVKSFIQLASGYTLATNL